MSVFVSLFSVRDNFGDPVARVFNPCEKRSSAKKRFHQRRKSEAIFICRLARRRNSPRPTVGERIGSDDASTFTHSLGLVRSRPMKGRGLLVAAIVSLLFCVTVIVFRGATLDHEISATYGASPTLRYGIRSQDGFISVGRIVFRAAPVPRNPNASTDIILASRRLEGGHGDVPSAFGFDYYSEYTNASDMLNRMGVLSFQVMSVAYGPLILATAALPAIWLYRARRRQIRRNARRVAGLCAQCGYDLRACNDACPECGTPVRCNNSSKSNYA
jgi:hypothetical protein